MKTQNAKAYNKVYAQYYDILTQHKDYFSETKKLNELIDSLKFSHHCALIDIGCGTGSHAIGLSKLRKNPISAYDISGPMVKVAREKESHVRFFSGDLSDIESRAFQFAYSLFNVVNCITKVSDLGGFFLEVNERLEIGGHYFFEFWNRAAVLKEPPLSVTRVFYSGQKKIIRLAEPDITLLDEGYLNLDYKIEMIDPDGDRNHFSSVHELRLHDLEDFQKLLENSGFEIRRLRGALPKLSENKNRERMLSILARKTAEPK